MPSDNRELLVDAQQDIEKLETTIESISSYTSKWIVSEIKMEGDNDIINVSSPAMIVALAWSIVFVSMELVLTGINTNGPTHANF